MNMATFVVFLNKVYVFLTVHSLCLEYLMYSLLFTTTLCTCPLGTSLLGELLLECVQACQQRCNDVHSLLKNMDSKPEDMQT